MKLHHPQIKHGRQLRQRQDGNTEQRCDHASRGVRLLRRLPRIWLAIHSSTWVSMSTAWVGAQLSMAVSGDSATVRGGTGKPGLGGCMMGDRLGQQVVETAIVAALGGSVVDFEQCLGLGAAHRLMLDGGRGQDARAPGGVIGIERAGKMNAAPGGGTFAGDHAVAHDGERMGCGLAAGRCWTSTLPAFSGLGRGADIVTLLIFFF